MPKQRLYQFRERERSVCVPSGHVVLYGELAVPRNATGIVLFAHGSGSSRHSSRNQYVARVIREASIATLLFDLLTPEEESVDIFTRHLRFNLDLLSERLMDATEWVISQGETAHLHIGYFGASTGGGAALVAAAKFGAEIGAVVSRGGRPDLAGEALPSVEAPTLLIVGAHDEPVIELNEEAYARLRCRKELKIVPSATHLFEEPGAIEQVAQLAAAWFSENLQPQSHMTGAASSDSRLVAEGQVSPPGNWQAVAKSR